MWMLLNKQVFKRQSSACAQNETATIKCLGQDVHQSVVFQKIPNKSSQSINGRGSQRKSYQATCPVRSEEEQFFATQSEYYQHTWPGACNLSFSSWYHVKISVRHPHAPLQRNNKHFMQHTKAHVCCINQESENIFIISHEHILMCFFFFSQTKQITLKSALTSKCVCVCSK